MRSRDKNGATSGGGAGAGAGGDGDDDAPDGSGGEDETSEAAVGEGETSRRAPAGEKRRPASREMTGRSRPGPESNPSLLPKTGQKKDPTGRNSLRPRRERGPAAGVESAESENQTKRPERRRQWRR